MLCVRCEVAPPAPVSRAQLSRTKGARTRRPDSINLPLLSIRARPFRDPSRKLPEITRLNADPVIVYTGPLFRVGLPSFGSTARADLRSTAEPDSRPFLSPYNVAAGKTSRALSSRPAHASHLLVSLSSCPNAHAHAHTHHFRPGSSRHHDISAASAQHRAKAEDRARAASDTDAKAQASEDAQGRHERGLA
jgi:hypothetical protein